MRRRERSERSGEASRGGAVVQAREHARRLASLASLASLAACSGAAQNPARGDAGASVDAGPFAEATHSPMPQLVYQEGPLIAAPEIVTVTFPGDPNADTLEAFDDVITTTAWWDTVTAGFCTQTGTCVGHGTPGGHVRLTAPPDASYTDSTVGGSSTLQAFLRAQIASGAFPPIHPGTVYVVYVPASTTIAVANPGEVDSCAGFRGYHSTVFVTPDDVRVPYVIVPECAPAAGSDLTTSQSLTFAASHEIIEAASDPDETAQTPQRLGYYLNLSDPTVRGWSFLAGGEAADLCSDLTGLRQDETTAGTYTVQRSWSNASAAAGLDPCVPAASGSAAGGAYFNVAPDAPSSFIVLNIGGNTTFEAIAFSTAATDEWTLEGVDVQSAQHGLKSPLLSFAFNGEKTAKVKNGDRVQVTVTLDADPEPFGGAEGILLSVSGSLTSPKAAHAWPILVVTVAEVDGGG